VQKTLEKLFWPTKIF